MNILEMRLNSHKRNKLEMTELFDNTLAESLVSKEQADVLGTPIVDVVTKIQVKRDALIAKQAEMSAAKKNRCNY